MASRTVTALQGVFLNVIFLRLTDLPAGSPHSMKMLRWGLVEWSSFPKLVQQIVLMTLYLELS